jgi:hypothetical protein
VRALRPTPIPAIRFGADHATAAAAVPRRPAPVDRLNNEARARRARAGNTGIQGLDDHVGGSHAQKYRLNARGIPVLLRHPVNPDNVNQRRNRNKISSDKYLISNRSVS